MKHTITIFSICTAALVSLTSCEKFFDREPLDQFAAEQFFATKTDLEYYANGLIDTALPDFDDVALGEDRYTDLCGTKESKNFFWRPLHCLDCLRMVLFELVIPPSGSLYA